jgi:hypothetical protein
MTTSAWFGANRGFAAVCGAVALSAGIFQMTAADRLVDSTYDQAIAVASSMNESTPPTNGLLRLASQSTNVRPGLPTAASEHAWLTRTVVPLEVAPVDQAVVGPVLGSTVGARFTVAHAGGSQTFEVTEISQILTDQVGRVTAASPEAAKTLLVTCRMVNDVKSGISGTAQVVRFIIDGDPAHPIRLHGLL